MNTPDRDDELARMIRASIRQSDPALDEQYGQRIVHQVLNRTICKMRRRERLSLAVSLSAVSVLFAGIVAAALLILPGRITMPDLTLYMPHFDMHILLQWVQADPGGKPLFVILLACSVALVACWSAAVEIYRRL